MGVSDSGSGGGAGAEPCSVSVPSVSSILTAGGYSVGGSSICAETLTRLARKNFFRFLRIPRIGLGLVWLLDFVVALANSCLFCNVKPS